MLGTPLSLLHCGNLRCVWLARRSEVCCSRSAAGKMHVEKVNTRAGVRPRPWHPHGRSGSGSGEPGTAGEAGMAKPGQGRGAGERRGPLAPGLPPTPAEGV